MDMRRAGIILIAVGVAILGLTYLFKLQEDKHLEQVSIETGTCFIDGECVYEERDFTLYIIGGLLGAFILSFGVYFIFLKHTGNAAGTSVTRTEIDTSQLTDEELKVYHYLKEHKGSAYQSELARDLELTKVKVTRILDRLEGFGVLERKRRGMTNIVILRN